METDKFKPKDFVTIIVPVYTNINLAKECITSLRSIEYPKILHEIVIVVDKNASQDVREALKDVKGIKIVYSKNKGGSAANRNLGIENADKTSKFYAFTDSDCVVDKQWLKELLSSYYKLREKYGEKICVGGINLIPTRQKGFGRLIGAIESTFFGGGGTAQSNIIKKEKKVISIPNCNALYPKDAWLEEKQNEYLIVGQDGEFNLRLAERKWKFFIAPDAKVWHWRTKTAKHFIRRMYNYGIASADVIKLHPHAIKSRWYAVIVALFTLYIFSAPFILFFTELILLKNVIIATLLMYIIILLITTLQVMMSTKMFLSLLTPFILFLQHILYGLGFIKGILSVRLNNF